MKAYCATCNVKNCELRDQTMFCEDCADYKDCTIRYEFCEKGHAVECNNGFEFPEDFDDEPEYDEFELLYGDGIYDDEEDEQ